MANDTHVEVLMPIAMYEELLEKYGADHLLVTWSGNQAIRAELKKAYADIRIIKQK